MTIEELLSPPVLYVLVAFAVLLLGAGVVLIEHTVRDGIEWSAERRQRDLIEEAVHTAYREAAVASGATTKARVGPAVGVPDATGAAREVRSGRGYGPQAAAPAARRSSSRAAPPS